MCDARGTLEGRTVRLFVWVHDREHRELRRYRPEMPEIAGDDTERRRLGESAGSRPLVVHVDLVPKDGMDLSPELRDDLVHRQDDVYADERLETITARLAPPCVLGSRPQFSDRGERQAEHVIT